MHGPKTVLVLARPRAAIGPSGAAVGPSGAAAGPSGAASAAAAAAADPEGSIINTNINIGTCSTCNTSTVVQEWVHHPTAGWVLSRGDVRIASSKKVGEGVCWG